MATNYGREKNPPAHVSRATSDHPGNPRPANPKPQRPTFHEYQRQIARGMHVEPYGDMPPFTSWEIQNQVDTYNKAYGTHIGRR